MINVVFLLLIFFLIAARLTPPEAFPVTLPDAAATGAMAEGRFTLLLGPEAEVAFGNNRGQSIVLAALKAELDVWCDTVDCARMPPELVIRADAFAPATALPKLMRDLNGLGFGTISLAVVPR